jgi:hypothetical protein
LQKGLGIRQQLEKARSIDLKKSQLYASLWQSCDDLRGGMDTDLRVGPLRQRLFRENGRAVSSRTKEQQYSVDKRSASTNKPETNRP